MSTFVADSLAEHGLTLDAAAQKQLTGDARSQLTQGLAIRRLTLQALDALAKERIVPVLLKGSGLAERLYGAQALGRPSTDVDVLVSVDELEAAARAMATLGLTRQHDESLHDVFEEHHHMSFAKAGALVEVHFRLFSGFGGHAFDDAAIRGRLIDGTFHGRAVRWLNPEDEFVYLATHAANHSFLRASWLLDLAKYLDHAPGLSWTTMAARCREAGFFSAVAAALFVLEHAMGLTLPAAARDAFSIGLLRSQGHRQLFAARHLESAAFANHRLAGFGLRIWLVDSPRAGVRHAFDGARRWLRQRRAGLLNGST